MLLLALGTAICTGNIFQTHYPVVLLFGCLSWGMSILAIHQIKNAVDQHTTLIIHRTITAVLLINVLVALGMYVYIMVDAGTLNPFRYQGNYQQYFIGTGDYIKGISFDTSTTNAIISAMGVLYFLQSYQYFYGLLSMISLLITGSNLTNLMLGLVLLIVFIFQSNRQQKSIIGICLIFMIIFWVKISPQNNQYIATAYSKITGHPAVQASVTSANMGNIPASLQSIDDQKKQYAQHYLDSLHASSSIQQHRNLMETTVSANQRPVIPTPSIHTAPFQHRNDTSKTKATLISFVQAHIAQLPFSRKTSSKPALPGKWLAWQYLYRFYLQHPLQLVAGAGMGRFSSKLAFRATGLPIAGGYPAGFVFISDYFMQGHLDLYLYYFTHADELHSVVNTPHSVYIQIFGEYGLLGIACFLLFIWVILNDFSIFQTGHRPYWSLLLMVLATDYWFEQLSVIVLFEFILLLKIKEAKLHAVS
jgi:hypothetical protein